MPTVSFDSRAELSLEAIQQFITKAGSLLTAKRVADSLAQKAMALDSVGSALIIFYTSPATDYEYRSLSHKSHRIVFTVLPQRIVVVDFFSGRRDLASLKESLQNFLPE